MFPKNWTKQDEKWTTQKNTKNNIPKSTLQNWIKPYNKYGPDAFMDSNKRPPLTLQEQNNLVELYLREKIKLTTFTVQRNSLVHLPFCNEREDQFLYVRLSSCAIALMSRK